MSEPSAGKDEVADAAQGASAKKSEVPAAPVARSKSMRRTIAHIAFALVGTGAMVLLVRHVGATVLLAALRTSAPWIPLVLLLEAMRMGCEVASTRLLYRPLVSKMPLRALIRAQIVVYPVMVLMPAGRATGETVKAKLLSPIAGGAVALAVGSISQALALLGGAANAIVCLVATLFVPGAGVLATGIAIHCATAVAGATLVQLTSRHRAIGEWIRKRFKRAGKGAVSYQEAVLVHPFVPPRPFVVFLLNRAFQTLQYGVLMVAVGGGFAASKMLVAQGINLVGTSLGDLVPGQIGATDSVFAFTSQWLGLSDASGVAISVLMHFVQVALALVCTLVPMVWREPPEPPLGSPPDDAKTQPSRPAGEDEAPAAAGFFEHQHPV